MGYPIGGIPYFLRRCPPVRTEGESPAASPSAAGGGRSEGAACAAVYIFKAALTAAENIGHRKPGQATDHPKPTQSGKITPASATIKVPKTIRFSELFFCFEVKKLEKIFSYSHIPIRPIFWPIIEYQRMDWVLPNSTSWLLNQKTNAIFYLKYLKAKNPSRRTQLILMRSP